MNFWQPNESNLVEEGIYSTEIKGLWYLERKQFNDKRGFFAEIGYTDKFKALIGKPFIIKQINHSRSYNRVARGMHAEDWKKLITVIKGTAVCALADVRPESSGFGRVIMFNLGEDKGALGGSLLVEEGIANSFCVINGPVDYVYCVDRLYNERDPKGDVAISMFDPDLNIQWPISKEEMILSERDKNSVTLRERFPEKFK